MKTKLDPKVFVRAAQRITTARGNGCCNAIYRAGNGSLFSEELRFFQHLFRRDGQMKTGNHFYWMNDHSRTPQQVKAHRVYALLLAAELAKEPPTARAHQRDGEDS